MPNLDQNSIRLLNYEISHRRDSSQTRIMETHHIRHHIRCFRVFTSELRAQQSTKIEQEMGNSSSHRGKRNVQHQNERPCRINIGVVGDSGTEELIEWFDVRFEIASNNAKLSLYPLSLSHYSFDLLFSLNKKKRTRVHRLEEKQPRTDFFLGKWQ